MELDICRSRYRPPNPGSSTTETALKSSTAGSHSVLVPALVVDALPSQGFQFFFYALPPVFPFKIHV